MSEALDYDIRTDPTAFITFREYLEGEKHAEVRHEYIDGRVFAMAGATRNHEIVALNLAASLHTHLKGSPCRAFKGDMKLKVEIQDRDFVYYPDIVVGCDPSDRHPLFIEKPKVLIEVMSDYKADNVEKLFVYLRIPSLEEYLVVDQDPANPQAWLYRRDNGWEQENGAPEGVVKLASLDFETTLAGLYA